MSSSLTIKIVSKTILDGMIKVEKDYRNWSGGDWLWRAPEYLITVYVSKQLASVKVNKYITLENSTKEAIEYAGVRGTGNLHSDIRSNGRVDILLWWAKGDPRAVIEIKNDVYTYIKIKKDVNRICRMLKRKSKKSSLEFGVISFYMSRYYKSKNPKEMMDKQINKLLNNTKNDAEKFCTVEIDKTDIKVENENNAWCCVNFILKPHK